MILAKLVNVEQTYTKTKSFNRVEKSNYFSWRKEKTNKQKNWTAY